MTFMQWHLALILGVKVLCLIVMPRARVVCLMYTLEALGGADPRDEGYHISGKPQVPMI